MNALNTLVRPAGPESHEDRDLRDETAAPGAERTEETPQSDRRGGLARVRDADGMAVASFVMGLAGLLVFNVVLGPCALVLGGLALMRGTTRRSRALFGLTLGAADLAVLAAVTAADGSASWSIAG